MPVSPRTFWTVSLRHWLQLAREAGTPHVDAVRIASVRVPDLMYYDTPGPHSVRLKAAWEAMATARKPGKMLRWDCCASAHLKHLMAHGRLPADDAEELQTLTIDERIFDCASEYPSQEIDSLATAMDPGTQGRHRRLPRGVPGVHPSRRVGQHLELAELLPAAATAAQRRRDRHGTQARARAGRRARRTDTAGPDRSRCQDTPKRPGAARRPWLDAAASTQRQTSS